MHSIARVTLKESVLSGITVLQIEFVGVKQTQSAYQFVVLKLNARTVKKIIKNTLALVVLSPSKVRSCQVC